MKIKFYMRTKESNGGEISTQGEVSTKEDIIKQFKEFVKNHGTGFNDFNEFGCLFIKDIDKKSDGD